MNNRFQFVVIILYFCLPQTSFSAAQKAPFQIPNLEIITPENIAQIIRLEYSSVIVGKLKAISHHSQFIVTETDDNLTVWDWQQQEIVWNFEYPASDYYRNRGFINQAVVEFNFDDTKLAIADLLGLRLVDLTTGDITMLREPHTIWDAAFSPDGSYIASARGYIHSCYECSTPPPNMENTVWIQDAKTGELQVEIWRPETEYAGFHGVAFSSDGSLFAALGWWSPIFLWDTSDLLAGELEPAAAIRGEQQAGDIAFSLDGTMLAISYALLETGGDGFASLPYPIHADVWQTAVVLEAGFAIEEAFEPYFQIFGISRDGAREIRFNTSGNFVMPGAWGELWDTNSGELAYQIDAANSLLMSPDDRIIFVEGEDELLQLWGIPIEG